jgi:hypothetical protein
MEAAMFNQHNQKRAAGGLGSLVVDAQLTAIARQRAQDMASKNYFAHTSPTGETAFTLMNAMRYVYAIAGENIARNNYPDAESVGTAMSGFMNSPSHRANIMDGRYTKVEWEGDMPGMGPYNGFGIYGFDNVSQEFVAIWIDNHSTGIMKGTGKLAADGKTLTWTYKHNCPITKKETTMRDVETVTGPNKKRLEMFGTDPKSGKEYKMMSVELTKK